MLKVYSITIILFYLSFILCLLRWSVNKENINSKSNNEKWFVFMRLLVIGCMPIINVVFTLIYIYISIFVESEKFIEFMNK
ncbi:MULTISPECIES: hypothetical protein [Clostridium]|uniref:Phage protein n=1 Tax=Clostridium neonatale TaxID=137838 RepID=A0AA86JDM6_9CLOT|nr:MULTISPECIES: hypothetical protein [Clostridium]DAM15921.1 MAG TPA: hypothetical protein [Caudoviricetes sp.]MDU4480149.1 hypothetical protein [Clostridium sp.]CAG9703794.1 Phage protein [Clostridium neonatale]CAG9714692.1 Phage protein [Clostridium neonatale]CAI3192000.1 Phage protein [Clostridium neonatale]